MFDSSTLFTWLDCLQFGCLGYDSSVGCRPFIYLFTFIWSWISALCSIINDEIQTWDGSCGSSVCRGPGSEEQGSLAGSRRGARTPSDHCRGTLEQGTKPCLRLNTAQTGSSTKHLTLIERNGNFYHFLQTCYLLISYFYMLFFFSFRVEIQLRFCEPWHDQGAPPCTVRWRPHCPVRPPTNDPVCLSAKPRQAGTSNRKHFYLLTPWFNVTPSIV